MPLSITAIPIPDPSNPHLQAADAFTAPAVLSSNMWTGRSGTIDTTLGLLAMALTLPAVVEYAALWIFPKPRLRFVPGIAANFIEGTTELFCPNCTMTLTVELGSALSNSGEI